MKFPAIKRSTAQRTTRRRTGAAAPHPLIAVLDDDPAVRAILVHLLQSRFTVISAPDSTCLRRLTRAKPPDLFVIDIHLRDENGIAVARRIRRTSLVPVLFLSGDGSEKTMVEALGISHSDFLAKPFHPGVLFARLRNALAAHERRAADAGDAPKQSAPSAGKIVLARRILRGRGPDAIGLTDVESRLLASLAHALPGAASRRELSQTIFGVDWGPTSRRVDVHVSHLRRKLEDATGVTARIVSVRGYGYRLDGV